MSHKPVQKGCYGDRNAVHIYTSCCICLAVFIAVYLEWRSTQESSVLIRGQFFWGVLVYTHLVGFVHCVTLAETLLKLGTLRM